MFHSVTHIELKCANVYKNENLFFFLKKTHRGFVYMHVEYVSLISKFKALKYLRTKHCFSLNKTKLSRFFIQEGWRYVKVFSHFLSSSFISDEFYWLKIDLFTLQKSLTSEPGLSLPLSFLYKHKLV